MPLTGLRCFLEKVFDNSAHFPFITVVSWCESRLGGGEGGGGGGEEEEEQELEPHSVLRPDTCSNLFLSFKFPIYFIDHVFGYIYVPKDYLYVYSVQCTHLCCIHFSAHLIQ